MAMATEKQTYGLLIKSWTEYGMRCVEATVVARRDGAEHPHNPPDNPWDTGLLLAGLGVHGFIANSAECPFIGYEPGYRNRYATHLTDAKRMVTTLKLVVKRLRLDAAETAPDQFGSICAALKLSFVVERIGDDRGVTYANNRWRWMTTGEGRNRYRALIEAAQAEELAKKQPAVCTAA